MGSGRVGVGGGGWHEKESTWFFDVSWYYDPHARLAHETEELVMYGEALCHINLLMSCDEECLRFLYKIDLVNYKNKLCALFYVSWSELNSDLQLIDLFSRSNISMWYHIGTIPTVCFIQYRAATKIKWWFQRAHVRVFLLCTTFHLETWKQTVLQ